MLTEQTKFLRALGVSKPTLLIDFDKVKSNIQVIKTKADSSGVLLRPHFKTHQSKAVGQYFKDAGIKAITVSSIEMANYFADAGWVDITIAFPVNPLEIIEIRKLSQKVNLTIIVDHIDTVRFLKDQIYSQVSVFVKIDIGYGRSGISFDNFAKIEQIVREISNSDVLFFQGVLTHAGHTYHVENKEEILTIYNQTLERLNKIKKHLSSIGYDSCKLSIGDTPSCTLVDDFKGVDEIRPGNLVFFDLVQENLNVCQADQIAVTMACPVVGKFEERQELVIYGGAVHFSKDVFMENGEPVYGYLAPFSNGHWQGIDKSCVITSLSQEHGKVKVSEKMMEEVKIGDILTFYPVHSCLTAHVHRYYISLNGEKISKM